MNNKEQEILAREDEIIKKEDKILNKLEKEEKEIREIKKRQNMLYVLFGVVAVIVVGGFIYYRQTSGRIYVEKSQILGDEVSLSPQTNGILYENFVREGDLVSPNAPIARVGNELIKSKISGVVISTRNDIGTLLNRGQVVAKMVDPNSLRVIGRVAEDKGLSEISVGQNAMFTVDAFSGKEYVGIVDEVSPTSREGDLVFSISGKREVREFDVKLRFDVNKYSELKNGMSAKVWIYKN
jgi:multidrug resistance efflux pump